MSAGKTTHRTAAEIIREIKEHPERHRHDFVSLQQCCMIDGALDLAVMEAHEGIYKRDGRGRHDVSSGPCSCGGWH